MDKEQRLNIVDNQVAEPDIFNSSDSEWEENDFLGFEVNSPLFLNEYLSFSREYLMLAILVP